jgi:glyoxylase-like metal-dependent hydrolase (beta-lactamase superfamily II)
MRVESVVRRLEKDRHAVNSRAENRRLALAAGIFFGMVSSVQLEDHLGDIIRKARNMSNVSAASGARIAGLTESGLAALEDSGQCPKNINLTALATIIGLDVKKLEGIANGWLPAATDLNQWQNLRAFTTAGEGMTVNCYLIWDEATRKAALFDTGMDAQPVLNCIAENKLSLRHIFITHSHWDHIEALPKFRAAFPSAQIHSAIKGAPKSQQLQSGENFSLGSLQITHRETPGHAEDGVTYFIDDWPGNPPRVAIVGDTILAGSMCNGNGQWALAKEKIIEEILTQPAATLLCAGHGPVTTVAQEKTHNPFF